MMNSQEFLDALISRLSDDTIYGSSLGRTAVLMNQYRPAQTLFLDSMGDATATMLGLAIALKEKCSVVAVDTDGCFLMNLSVLPMLEHCCQHCPAPGLLFSTTKSTNPLAVCPVEVRL
jgi:thiamine pyrophosphate-dependent acetolactate synthase large subunit-like protein